MPRFRFVVCFLALSLTASLAAAQTVTFDLDPQATQISFGFGATLHSVHGTLKAASGKVDLDLATGKASGDIVLDMKSAATGNEKRDQNMHQKVLETERFPQAVFHVERVDGEVHREGRSELQLHGTLDLHGGGHAVAIPIVAMAQGDTVTATGMLDIPYVEWGLEDPSFFLLRVDKVVHVQIRGVGKIAG